jgi:hypothetical protein
VRSVGQHERCRFAPFAKHRSDLEHPGAPPAKHVASDLNATQAFGFINKRLDAPWVVRLFVGKNARCRTKCLSECVVKSSADEKKQHEVPWLAGAYLYNTKHAHNYHNNPMCQCLSWDMADLYPLATVPIFRQSSR